LGGLFAEALDTCSTLNYKNYNMYVSQEDVLMTTKLTLRLDDTVIRKAKKTASKKGVSLSRMVEDYFKAVADQGAQEVRESPVLYEVSGVLTGKQDAEQLRMGYRKHIAEKYR
jgi:hypothetical protein